MAYDAKTDAEITQWINNISARPGGRDTELYAQLLEERARRDAQRNKLEPEKSLAHLTDCARRGIYTTYGALADVSGVEWAQARHRMNGAGGHLDGLMDLCAVRKLPLLPAICVNKTGLARGELDEAALQGFAKAGKRLGYAVDNAHAFHRQCCDEVMAWGRKQLTGES